jgi:hypothetical protein
MYRTIAKRINVLRDESNISKERIKNNINETIIYLLNSTISKYHFINYSVTNARQYILSIYIQFIADSKLQAESIIFASLNRLRLNFRINFLLQFHEPGKGRITFQTNIAKRDRIIVILQIHAGEGSFQKQYSVVFSILD